MEDLPSTELRELGGSGGCVGLPGQGGHCLLGSTGKWSGVPVSLARVGGRGGSWSEPRCSADVSRGFRVRAFSA